MSEPEMQEFLKKLSDNEMRLGESISAITQSHLSLDSRVKTLELKEQANEVAKAREDERDKALFERLTRLENVGRSILWLIFTGFATAVVGWIIRGGLS